jgi:hypothetical protein
MTTQLTPRQEQIVNEYFTTMMNLRTKVANSTDPKIKESYQDYLDSFIPSLEENDVLPQIINALKERVRVADEGANAGSPPTEGGRKSRKRRGKGKRKGKNTRRR